MRGRDEWLFIVRTDGKGETRNKMFELEDPMAVSLKFSHGKLDKSKTLKAKPEFREAAQHFVDCYTARVTPSTKNVQVAMPMY